MKKYLTLLLALVMCLSMVACASEPAPEEESPAAPVEGNAPAEENSPSENAPTEEKTPAEESTPAEGADDEVTIPTITAEEQKIRIGDNVYQQVLRGLLEQGTGAVTVTLESDVVLTSFSVVLGSSDYGGLFQGNVMAVAPTDITLDLNGHTIAGEVGFPVFEVQEGYTLTVVDGSADQSGRMITRGDVDVLVNGGTYHPLDK